MKRILIIEDDPGISDIVAFNLEQEGYRTQVAANGEEGLLAFASKTFDLVLLDIMIPRLNGLEVLDSIRSRSNVPVLIVSAKTAEEDRLQGLGRMADDYICKPFSVKELMLRVKVHLARYGGAEQQGEFSWGEFRLNEDTATVTRAGEPVPLTKKEFQLMLFFAKNQGKCYSREEIMCALWGYRQLQPEDRTVDVTVRRLREKIEPDSSHPRYIISKRGVGYMAGEGI